MSLITYYRKLPLSNRLYLATGLGLFLGIFFGSNCSILEPLNTTAIKVFQITIIPYMVFSLLQSIGSMSVDSAKLISRKGGIILVSLWAVSIFYSFGLNYSFPDIARGKFFRPETALGNAGVNFYDLFIPTNPFYSLANGYIPAIVIFFILAGVSLIQEEQKSKIIELSQILASMMRKMNDYIMILLPFGVLVMSTYTFGTICFVTLKGVLLYIIASIFYLIFMSVVIYPGIMATVSNINYRKFLNYTMPAAIVAFTTGSVFLALPVIYNQMYNFADKEKNSSLSGEDDNKAHNLISIIVPLAWVVPASYKFLVIFFIIFENWYYDTSLKFIEQLVAYLGGIPCLFGSNSVVVPFLLGVTGLPNKAYDIFMIVSRIMVYFNNANGAIFIVVCTMLCYMSICGKLRISWSKLIAIIILSTLGFSVFIMGLSRLMTVVLSGDNEVKEELMHMDLQSYNSDFYQKISVSYLNLDQYNNIEYLNSEEKLLDKIVRTGILQVGYDPEAIPFSFFNGQGKLVGYDIDFVYDIAENLGCSKIEFYPISNFFEYNECLAKGIMLDICVGGCVYQSRIEGGVITSEPYMKLTSAIVIPIKYKKQYPDYMSVVKSKDLTIGIRVSTKNKNQSYYGHPLVELKNYKEFYEDHIADALLTTGEKASAISIVYHGYLVYYYTRSANLKVFYAYLLPYNDRANTFRDVVNAWILTCRWDEVAKKRYNYWIIGEADIKVREPWSILGWLQKNKYFVGTEVSDSLEPLN